MSAESAATAAIASWRGRGIPEAATVFARAVVAASDPVGPARARSLLWATSRLGAFGVGVGLEVRASVLLHPSVIERFVVQGMATRSPGARRTIRTNLRFVARRAAPSLPHPPDPTPLRRHRAKSPYGRAEVDAYFDLARTQSTESRRHRLLALLCLGLGAGLDGADLRHVRGAHVVERGGGLVVVVEGVRDRVVPVLARYHAQLQAAAAFAGDSYICGGQSPTRRNVTAPLTGGLDGGADLARLEVGRLRATWLAEQMERLGLGALMAAAGIVCSQRLGDLVGFVAPVPEAAAVAMLG